MKSTPVVTRGTVRKPADVHRVDSHVLLQELVSRKP